MTDSIFSDIGDLFATQRKRNPIEVYISQAQGRDRSGRKRSDGVEVAFGDDIIDREFILLPHKQPRSFEGTELAEAVVEKYNQDYWLISLWNRMAENAAGSAIGREIVRALVKHCILLTAEELIEKRKTRIDAGLVRSGLADRITYYKRVFNWSDVFRCVREPERTKLEDRLKRDRTSDVGFRLKRKIGFVGAAQSIPEINSILQQSNLPDLIEGAREQEESLAGFVQLIYIKSLFLRDSRRLRRELRKFTVRE